MRNITVIFQKQIKDTFKNKEVLIQFVMFPIMALIMEKLVKVEELPQNYFVNLFSSMYVGMAPLGGDFGGKRKEYAQGSDDVWSEAIRISVGHRNLYLDGLHGRRVVSWNDRKL